MTKKKKSNKRRRRLIKFIIFMGLIYLIFSNIEKKKYFNIKEIIVEGNNYYASDEVIMASELELGENIFKIRLRKVEEALEKKVYIKESKIKRSLPNKIRIYLLEREEIFQIENPSSYLFIDKEGILLSQRGEKNEGLINLKGINIEKVEIGQDIFQDFSKEELEDFSYFLDYFDLLRMIEEINIAYPDNITIRLKNALDIDFGPMDNVRYKLSLINEIFKEKKQEGKNYKRIILNKGAHPILVYD